jgi:hypothetical protein
MSLARDRDGSLSRSAAAWVAPGRGSALFDVIVDGGLDSLGAKPTPVVQAQAFEMLLKLLELVSDVVAAAVREDGIRARAERRAKVAAEQAKLRNIALAGKEFARRATAAEIPATDGRWIVQPFASHESYGEDFNPYWYLDGTPLPTPRTVVTAHEISVTEKGKVRWDGPIEKVIPSLAKYLRKHAGG